MTAAGISSARRLVSLTLTLTLTKQKQLKIIHTKPTKNYIYKTN
jgi:hypothetical protein